MRHLKEKIRAVFLGRPDEVWYWMQSTGPSFDTVLYEDRGVVVLATRDPEARKRFEGVSWAGFYRDCRPDRQDITYHTFSGYPSRIETLCFSVHSVHKGQ